MVRNKEDIRRLQLGEYLTTILIDYGIVDVSNLKNYTEEQLCKLPGIGSSSAKKICIAYKIYSTYKSNALNKSFSNTSFADRIIRSAVNKPGDKRKETVLSQLDQQIMELLIAGCTQQDIKTVCNISDRTIRHRLTQLKLIYDAKTLPQLVYKIFC